jgi:hypothetical protein
MWFADTAKSYGVQHAGSFSPIPLPTLALLMAMVCLCAHPVQYSPLTYVSGKIEFCLKEWETGVFVSKHLNEFDLKKDFSGHLKSVASWDSLVPEVTERIRQKIFDDLRYVQCLLLTLLLLIQVDSASAGPADAGPSGTSYLSAEMTARLAADLASRTGDSDEEADTFGAGEDSDTSN